MSEEEIMQRVNIIIAFMKEELNDELFDFVREDEEFKQIVEQLNKA